MRIICIIPARLASTRFPKKILQILGQKPILQWVYEAALATRCFDEVAIALDSVETAEVVESFGGKYFMTSPDCESGTDRLVELMQKKLIEGDIWVNWQGDEPFIHKIMIENLLQSTHDKRFDIWTLKKQITTFSEVEMPHVCKVVTDQEGKALYFSRSPIPYCRDKENLHKIPYFRHIGIYAFTQSALEKIALLKPSTLELAEMLEQLRFLSHGFQIQVHETRYDTIGIDLPEHLVYAEGWLASSKGVKA